MSLSKKWFSAVRGCAPSDISKPYMLGTFALPFHYEMLSDTDRVYAFERAIDSIVDKDHVVLDVGTGSGILALLAARKASRVYAIEMDPTLAAIAAQNFRLSPNRQKLSLLVGNATELNLPEQVDIVICEMMDTVMLNEAQVPVLREVVKRLLKPNGRVIPSSIVNMGALAHSKFQFYGVVQMRVPHYERADLASSDMLSGWQKISTVEFGADAPDLVEVSGTFMSPTGGCVNSLILKTVVHFGDGSTLGPCPTLNVPVVIPIEEDVELKTGQSCEVYIHYQHFDTFNNVTCKVVAL